MLFHYPNKIICLMFPYELSNRDHPFPFIWYRVLGAKLMKGKRISKKSNKGKLAFRGYNGHRTGIEILKVLEWKKFSH